VDGRSQYTEHWMNVTLDQVRRDSKSARYCQLDIADRRTASLAGSGLRRLVTGNHSLTSISRTSHLQSILRLCIVPDTPELSKQGPRTCPHHDAPSFPHVRISLPQLGTPLTPQYSRDLYGQARHGIVQLSVPGYDSTLKSHPDAALRYLDEDDGETITVGSGFELGQRLEDPIPRHKATILDDDQEKDDYIPQHLHTFEIERTSHSVAAWMDHEAYSSKSLRSLSLSSTNSAQGRSWTDEPRLGGHLRVHQPVESLQSSLEPTLLSSEPSNGTELDMYEEGYNQQAPCTLSVAIETGDDLQIFGGLLPASETEATVTVDKIVSSAVEGIASHLDSHIDTLADFLQNTSKALRVVAEKTRESDTSAVEGILSGFNAIFGEVGKLAKAVLETAEATTAADPVELDLQQIHETTSDKGKGKEVSSPESKQNELPASVEVGADIVEKPLPVLVSSPRPIVRVATQPAQQVKLSPIRHRGTELTARLPASQLDKLYHIPSKSFIDSQPQEISAEKDPMYATFERGGFNPDSDRTWKYMPLPDDDQMSKTKKNVDFALPNGTIRPRETAKSSSESFPRSILDLETSDPDFSARFPPLMTVRRSKTMESLRQRSRSPNNRMRSRQDALKRFPSLVQLERRKDMDSYQYQRNGDEDRRMTSAKGEEQPVSDMHRAWFEDLGAKTAEPVKNEFSHQCDEVEEVIAAVGRDIVEASNEVRRLPGAWPEVQVASKVPLPTSTESSGAFFNRMTGQAVIPERRQPTPFPEPQIPRWQSAGYMGGHATQKLKQVERAQSMASLNPSATLTTPFDPLLSSTIVSDSVETGTKSMSPPSLESASADTGPAFATYQNEKDNLYGMPPSNSGRDPYVIPRRNHHSTFSRTDGVHRSATEKMPHRRPYSHRYSGAGRLPWENFEDHTFDLRTGSFLQRQERARRAADRPIPQPATTSDADTRQWTLPEYSSRAPAPARQNPTHPIKLPSDLHKRVNDYRAGLRHRALMPTVGIAKQSKINDCIRQLRIMGFGNDDENEASRLSVYAGATGGDIFEAVEMIEEDRKAGSSFAGRRQTGPENGPGGWL
jgi:hypothetical protein